jgi:hypothetical protein
MLSAGCQASFIGVFALLLVGLACGEENSPKSAADCGGNPCCFIDHEVGTRCAAGPSCDAESDPVCSEAADCRADVYLCCTNTTLSGTRVSYCAATLAACS